MYILAALFFWFIGITMVLKPELVFQIRESRKYASDAEPSKMYIISTRIGGVLLLAVGVAAFIVQFFM